MQKPTYLTHTGTHKQKPSALLHFRIVPSPPPRFRVRATVKLSTAFFHDESWITIAGGGGGGYESAIASLDHCFQVVYKHERKSILVKLVLETRRCLQFCGTLLVDITESFPDWISNFPQKNKSLLFPTMCCGFNIGVFFVNIDQ